MTRAQSMDVVNAATDFLNETNKLRLPIQTWDWSPEIEWWPGDPLYTPPEKIEGCGGPCCEDYSMIPSTIDENGQSVGGQHVRPMFEVFNDDVDFDIDEWFMDCEDCQVSGSGSERETHCWNCGKELAGLWRPSGWNVWTTSTRMMSFNELADIVPYDPPIHYYEAGDAIEGFDSAAWMRTNDFSREMGTLGFPSILPWQDRFLREYAAADAETTRRLFIQPRRNYGRQYLESMVSAYFQNIPIIDIEAVEIPNAYQITESRNTRRPAQPQRTYPTSSNPTQERRRRNH